MFVVYTRVLHAHFHKYLSDFKLNFSQLVLGHPVYISVFYWEVLVLLLDVKEKGAGSPRASRSSVSAI